MTSTASNPTTPRLFTVTEEVVDFARVATLFILQEKSVTVAANAQSILQSLFSRANQGKTQLGFQVTLKDAARVDVGGNNTVNLVAFSVDVGQGPVGGRRG